METIVISPQKTVRYGKIKLIYQPGKYNDKEQAIINH